MVEAIDTALEQDGSELLSGAEIDVIREHRDRLSTSISEAGADDIKKLIKLLENASEHYVAKRMNSSVKQALAGKQIDEVGL